MNEAFKPHDEPEAEADIILFLLKILMVWTASIIFGNVREELISKTPLSTTFFGSWQKNTKLSCY